MIFLDSKLPQIITSLSSRRTKLPYIAKNTTASSISTYQAPISPINKALMATLIRRHPRKLVAGVVLIGTSTYSPHPPTQQKSHSHHTPSPQVQHTASPKTSSPTLSEPQALKTSRSATRPAAAPRTIYRPRPRREGIMMS